MPARSRLRGALVPPWIAGYGPAVARRDAVAGLTVAVALVPQSLAYAALAGMPPVTGLYAALPALVIYALLGTSSHLSMGPVALVALLTAAGLAPIAGGDPAGYVALAAALAVLTGLLQAAMGLLRLGAVVRFVSHPVIEGFTAAAVVIIAVGQVPGLLGFDDDGSARLPDALAGLITGIGDANPATVAVGLGALVALVAGKRLVPEVPMTLPVAAVATAATFALGLPRFGVAVLGEVPRGLPVPHLPPLDAGTVRVLGVLAVTVALVSFTENISIAKAAAARSRERIAPNRELVASGAANVGAGLFGGLPVAGSFSRTALSYEAGARTPANGIVAAAGVVVTLLLLTGVLAYLPRAVLSAIVIAAVVALVDLRAVRQTFRTSTVDGALLAFTFAATLGLGIEAGILTGIGLNLLVYLLRHTRPHVAELGRVEGTTTFRNVRRYPVVTDPAVAIVRVDAELDFMTVDSVTGAVGGLAAERPSLRCVVLDTSAVTGIDATGVHALEGLAADLEQAGVVLHLATVRGPVRDVLQRSGAWTRLGADRWHPDIDSALAAAGLAAGSPLRRPAGGERRPRRIV